MSSPCRTIQMVTGLRDLPLAPAGVSSRSSAAAILSSSAFVEEADGDDLAGGRSASSDWMHGPVNRRMITRLATASIVLSISHPINAISSMPPCGPICPVTWRSGEAPWHSSASKQDALVYRTYVRQCG